MFQPDAFETLLNEQLARLASTGKVPELLTNAMHHGLLSPGKRLRPRLVYASAGFFGLPVRAIESAALAVEMVHSFTLIHDDLPCMDNDDIRRGRPTTHKAHGEALALLSGDALIPLAFECLLGCRAIMDQQHLLSAMALLLDASGAKGVIGGQVKEMQISRDSTREQLFEMVDGKTGALFCASLLIPAALAGLNSDDARWTALERIGRSFGRAFQLLDDLDDEEQDQQAGENPSPSILWLTSAAEAKKLILEEIAQAEKALQVLEKASLERLQAAHRTEGLPFPRESAMEISSLLNRLMERTSS